MKWLWTMTAIATAFSSVTSMVSPISPLSSIHPDYRSLVQQQRNRIYNVFIETPYPNVLRQSTSILANEETKSPPYQEFIRPWKIEIQIPKPEIMPLPQTQTLPLFSPSSPSKKELEAVPQKKQDVFLHIFMLMENLYYTALIFSLLKWFRAI